MHTMASSKQKSEFLSPTLFHCKYLFPVLTTYDSESKSYGIRTHWNFFISESFFWDFLGKLLITNKAKVSLSIRRSLLTLSEWCRNLGLIQCLKLARLIILFFILFFAICVFRRIWYVNVICLHQFCTSSLLLYFSLPDPFIFKKTDSCFYNLVFNLII